MKIQAIADLHGKLPPDCAACDVLIVAGDICPDNQFTRRDRAVCGHLQLSWVEGIFLPWLRRQPARHYIAIWGNHDFAGELPWGLWPSCPSLSWLQDSDVEIEGVRFYGTPWTYTGWGWALELPTRDRAFKFAAIPKATDVLITHGPPHGCLDVVVTGQSVGCPQLAQEIERVQPQLHIFGHIHESRGSSLNHHNVSAVDVSYTMHQQPWVPLEVCDPKAAQSGERSE